MPFLEMFCTYIQRKDILKTVIYLDSLRIFYGRFAESQNLLKYFGVLPSSVTNHFFLTLFSIKKYERNNLK